MNKSPQVALVQRRSDQPLVPYYDDESQLINVKRPTRSGRRYQVNVDNVLIFNLAEGGLVTDFYLMIRKDLWQVREPFPPKPHPILLADLEFSKDAIDQKFFGASVTPWIVPETNQQRTAVRFFLSPESSHMEPIELSEGCIAFVEDGQLVGFYLDLSP